MRISDWSSDVCSSDLYGVSVFRAGAALFILMGLAGCTGLVPSAGQRGAPPPQRASGTAPAARPVPAQPMDALPAARPTTDISPARGLGLVPGPPVASLPVAGEGSDAGRVGKEGVGKGDYRG